MPNAVRDLTNARPSSAILRSMTSRDSSTPLRFAQNDKKASWFLSGHDVMTCEKLRSYRQLVCCKTQRLPCDRIRHTVQFKQNVARPHRRDPELGLAFPFAH